MTNNLILEEELGKKADKKLVQDVSQEIIKSWSIKKSLPKNPIVLLLGGFQGSGKTTILDMLEKELDLLIISPDKIRIKLFARKIPLNEFSNYIVYAVRNELLRKAIALGCHIAIDQTMNSIRMNVMKEIVQKISKGKYEILAVFLKASKETLERRVANREQLPGVYKGTVNELRKSMKKYGEQDSSTYDLVLDGEKMQPEEIAEIIKKEIKK